MSAKDSTPFSDFLKKYASTKDDDGVKKYTHTRIGNNQIGKSKIYGGSYNIPDNKMPEFWELYHNHVFVKKKIEYLTEKQLRTNGPMLVDLDFRYGIDIDRRQHTKDHIVDLIEVYLEEIKKMLVLNDKPFNIEVFEKPNVNRLTEASIVKDGIHMLFGIQMDNILQVILREKILSQLPDLWGGDGGLPITNTFEQVLDDGISAGHTNWQLYGSRKPDNEAYCLKYSFTVSYDTSDGEFVMSENNVTNTTLEQLKTLSARNTNFPKFEIHPDAKAELDVRMGKTNVKRKHPMRKLAIDVLPFDKITSKEVLTCKFPRIMMSCHCMNIC